MSTRGEHLLQEVADKFGDSFPTEDVAKALAFTPSPASSRGQRAHAVFTTHYRPRHEDTFLAVCGAEAGLGGWNPYRGLLADSLPGGDWWIATADLPVNTEIEWKWVAVTGDEINWESGKNRRNVVRRKGLLVSAEWDQHAVTGEVEQMNKVISLLGLKEETLGRRLSHQLSHGVQIVINIPLHITFHLFDSVRGFGGLGGLLQRPMQYLPWAQQPFGPLQQQQGIMTSQQLGMTSQQLGMTSQPLGVTSQPLGMTSQPSQLTMLMSQALGMLSHGSWPYTALMIVGLLASATETVALIYGRRIGTSTGDIHSWYMPTLVQESVLPRGVK